RGFQGRKGLRDARHLRRAAKDGKDGWCRCRVESAVVFATSKGTEMKTRSLLCALLLPGFATLAAPGLAAPGEREAMDFFEAKIRPVLVEHCYKCHSVESKKRKGELWLDSRAGLLEGGKSGPALVPGDPGKSRLIEAIRYRNPDLQMPPDHSLPPAVVADF